MLLHIIPSHMASQNQKLSILGVKVVGCHYGKFSFFDRISLVKCRVGGLYDNVFCPFSLLNSNASHKVANIWRERTADKKKATQMVDSPPPLPHQHISNK